MKGDKNMKRDKEDSRGLVNIRDLARAVSDSTGFTIQDVEKVIRLTEEAIADGIRKGYDVKLHKNYKLEVHKRPSKRIYDGLHKTYKELPERYVVKLKPLSMLTKAIDDLNEESILEDEEE